MDAPSLARCCSPASPRPTCHAGHHAWLSGSARLAESPWKLQEIRCNGVGTRRALFRRMAVWLRIVLWVVVAVVPGGLLLLPILIRDEVRRRRQPPSSTTQPTTGDGFAETTFDPV